MMVAYAVILLGHYFGKLYIVGSIYGGLDKAGALEASGCGRSYLEVLSCLQSPCLGLFCGKVAMNTCERMETVCINSMNEKDLDSGSYSLVIS